METGKKVSEWATELKNLSVDEKYSKIILCRSAWQKTGADNTRSEDFEKYFGVRPYPSNSDRILGKEKLHEYLRWKPKPKKNVRPYSEFNQALSESIYRMHGSEALKNYVEQFKPEEDELNIPKLQIFDCCKHLIATFPKCQYEGQSSNGKLSEDVKEFKGDDPYDTIRYLVLEADLMSNIPDRFQSIEQKIASAIEDVKYSNDQTKYHRVMQKLDKEKANVLPKPVYRKRFYVH
jgi:hypothetical protein